MTQYKTGKITIHGRLGDKIIFLLLYTRHLLIQQWALHVVTKNASFCINFQILPYDILASLLEFY